jgi:signal transduction histidine kinase
MINEAGRRLSGQAPSALVPLTEQYDVYRVRDPRTDQPFSAGETAVERALRGELVEAQAALFRRPGEAEELRLQVSAAPLGDRAGGVRGAVVVYTDVTELHRAIAERARLDGAVKTARLIAHELNNKLTAVVANADLLLSRLDGESVKCAEEIVQGAEEAAAIVARLNQIVRVEEADVGLGVPVLDLEASTRVRPPAA